MSFHVGQKVEYIGAEKHEIPVSSLEHEDLPFPKRKTPYTVCNFYVAEGGVLAIELSELPCPETEETEAGYRAELFRPLILRKADISIFTAMLDGVKQGEPA